MSWFVSVTIRLDLVLICYFTFNSNPIIFESCHPSFCQFAIEVYSSSHSVMFFLLTFALSVLFKGVQSL